MSNEATNVDGKGRGSLKLPDEFTGSAVPDSRTVSGVRIGFVLIGMGINFTGFALAADAAISGGFVRGIAACVVAGLVLGVGGAITGYVGAKLRLSAFMILRRVFGTSGAGVVNLLLMFLAFGFFCVLSSMLGGTLAGFLAAVGMQMPQWACSLGGAVLVAAATLYGFVALQKITFFLLPLLTLGLLWLATVSVQHAGAVAIMGYAGHGRSFGIVLSALLGGFVGFVVVFPNLTRYACTPRDGVVAGLIGMAVGFPVILILAAISAVAAGKKDVVAVVGGLGFGAFALALAAISIWKTNVLNLYTTYLGVAAMRSSVSRVWLISAAGVAGGLLGAINVDTYFLPFLLFFAVAAPPIAVIYSIDCLTRGPLATAEQGESVPAYQCGALGSWIVAATVGGLALAGIVRLTGVPSLDSALTAGVVFGAAALLRGQSAKLASSGQP
jgi:cytosine permease